jgi:hypothetical protein
VTAQRLENAQSVYFHKSFMKIDAFYAARAPCAVKMTGVPLLSELALNLTLTAV